MAEKNLSATDEHEFIEIADEEASNADDIAPVTTGPTLTVVLITKVLCPSTKLLCK